MDTTSTKLFKFFIERRHRRSLADVRQWARSAEGMVTIIPEMHPTSVKVGFTIKIRNSSDAAIFSLKFKDISAKI